uniref:NADPH--hemoprotein reductase n=2 Tax=Babesia bovis TaxID=5865 RepID=A7AW87_BABBO|eukprot:XP_001608883.1 flavodoxin and oxidoreductase NAD-binding domain containing protein [Babesia bovis T2Bo]
MIITSTVLFYVAYYVWNSNSESTDDANKKENDNETNNNTTEKASNTNIEADNADVSKKIVVYYGSQTGTAERFAKTLAHRLADWNSIFQRSSVNLEEFDEHDLLRPNTIAIFLIATHDDGHFPDNAERFVRWLRLMEDESKRLECLEYCIFGLGSTEYPQFNNASKNLNNILINLGAKALLPIKLGDDATDLKSDFEEWSRDVCNALAKRLVIEPVSETFYEKPLLVSLKETWRDCVPLELRYLSKDQIKSDCTPISATVVCKQQWQCVDHVVIDNINMTPESEETTNMLTIESYGEFNAAETINVLYANPPKVVSYFMDKLNIKEQDMEKLITFVPRYATVDTQMNFEAPFPIPCTIGDALRYYLDLTGLPDEETLRNLGTFLQSNHSCQYLNKLFKRKALMKIMKEELHLTLQEFIEIFMHDAIFNIGGFLQIIPKKVTKAYTVSSHPKTNKIDLTIKLVKKRNFTFKTFKSRIQKEIGYEVRPGTEKMFALHRMYKGACTHYLCSLQKGDVVKLYKRPSAFSLISDIFDKPLVMIANGSGIAPFRALWQQGNTTHRRIIFFGFRDEQHILYKEEIEGLKNMPNYSVNIALSRTGKHEYVQHILRNHIIQVQDILNSSGLIYVCGSKAMGAQVKAMLQHFLKIDIAVLKTQQKYVEELW